MIGPTAKAEPMTKPAAPIVCPRLSLGVIVIKTVWNDGNKIPTAVASNKRPNSANQKVGAKIIIKVPIPKRAKTLR
jgi:hypothetical protein